MTQKQMLSRTLTGLFWITLVVLGAMSVRNIQRTHAEDRVVDASSVVLREVITKTDGTKMPGPIYTFATRSDGSAVFKGITNQASPEEPVRMIRLASGSLGYISDAKRQKYLRPMPADANPASPQNVRRPTSLCTMPSIRESALREEQISGYRAERVSMGNRTSWYAMDFGCALVKEHFDWEDGSKTDKYLLMLRAGEPETSLFTVPSDYADVPKSTFER